MGTNAGGHEKEDRAISIMMLVILVLCVGAVIGGVVTGFARGRYALGFILAIGVPAILVSPIAVYRKISEHAPTGRSVQSDKKRKEE